MKTSWESLQTVSQRWLATGTPVRSPSPTIEPALSDAEALCCWLTHLSAGERVFPPALEEVRGSEPTCPTGRIVNWHTWAGELRREGLLPLFPFVVTAPDTCWPGNCSCGLRSLVGAALHWPWRAFRSTWGGPDEGDEFTPGVGVFGLPGHPKVFFSLWSCVPVSDMQGW